MFNKFIIFLVAFIFMASFSIAHAEYASLSWRIGNSFEGMKIISVSKHLEDQPFDDGNVNVELKGKKQLDGFFEYVPPYANEFDGGNYGDEVCFHTTNKMFLEFCFEDTPKTKRLLGITKNKKTQSGRASININSLSTQTCGCETSGDHAMLAKVLSKQNKYTIIGRYFWEGDRVCLSNLDNSSRKLLVRQEKNLDICFTNQNFARKKFSPKGSTGKTAIVIEEYNRNDLVSISELEDAAKLVKVLKKN